MSEMTELQLADLVAIDTHVHIECDAHGHLSLDRELMDASAAYFKAGAHRTPTVDDVATYYRQRKIAAVVFTVDAHTATGHAAVSSAEIIERARDHGDVLIPFASVDPHDDNSVERLHTLARAGAKGLKLHPSLQNFLPNDPKYYLLYSAAADLGLPVVFHTGQTGIGAGLPGGRGIRLRCRIRCSSTMSQRIIPTSPSCWRIPRFRGKTVRYPSQHIRQTSSSICRAGHRSTFQPNWSKRQADSSATRYFSALTFR